MLDEMLEEYIERHIKERMAHYARMKFFHDAILKDSKVLNLIAFVGFMHPIVIEIVLMLK